MNVKDAIVARRSVRGFLNREVEPALLKDLAVRAARAATGGNIQPWHVEIGPVRYPNSTLPKILPAI